MTRLTALWHVTEVLAKTYIQHKRKTKQNKKGKKAKLETKNVTIRPSSENKKHCQNLPQLIQDKHFQ